MTAKCIPAKCLPCTGDVPMLTPDEIQRFAADIPEWTVAEDGRSISRTFVAKDFDQLGPFIFAVCMESMEHDHHPDFKVFDYRYMTVWFTTKAVGGLTMNDFVMARILDAGWLEVL